MTFNYNRTLSKIGLALLILTTFCNLYFRAPEVNAFPIYAQQSYENPREATGRIVCANCHLAQRNIELELPKSVLPNTVFEATITIPFNTENKQILSSGKRGNLNVGAVLILPDGFKIAPKELIPEEIKQKTKNTFIQPYSTNNSNILVVGPMPSNTTQTITFPILSPDPAKDKNIHFLKYPIYAGGNRGRGQVYPSGDKSNNNPIISPANGKVISITKLENEDYQVNIEATDGKNFLENIPKNFELQVKEGDSIIANQFLTQDPNVGGFGQNEAEIVLQSPNRVKGMILFFIIISVAQTLFVIKKKQWEKVQVSEMNF
uniref:Cytochrome f n=1 Tax=Porolithon onkodes TaxID=231751 RepID=A0A2Z2L3F6_9FLOR|nr:cytochrome f [Porolithon onkodes]ASB29743.1 cytochrome f [Porolithon onkodes]